VKKKSSSKSGFSILGAISFSFIVVGAAFAVFMYKRSIDNETSFRSAKHAAVIAEDTLKTSIQLDLADRNDISNIKTYISQINNFSVSVAGTREECGGVECKIEIEKTATSLPNITFSNCITPVGATVPTCTPTTVTSVPSSGEEYAIIPLVYSGQGVSKIKFKRMEVKILLPSVTTLTSTGLAPTTLSTQAQTSCLAMANPWADSRCAPFMRSSYCPQNPAATQCLSLNPLQCPHTAPVFVGTKIVGGVEKANCKTIDRGDFLTQDNQTSLNVTCKITEGKWLTYVNNDLRPRCTDFASDVHPSRKIALCSDPNKVAKSFQIDQNFHIQATECVSQGDPYDFIPENGTWN